MWNDFRILQNTFSKTPYFLPTAKINSRKKYREKVAPGGNNNVTDRKQILELALNMDQLGSLVVRAVAPCLGGRGPIPGRVKPKISNW